MKDGSSLVVTPSSIPSFTTRRPNVDLSSDEGSKDVLEDFEDKPIIRMRVSNFDEDGGGGERETEAMGMCLLSLTNLLLLFIL